MGSKDGFNVNPPASANCRPAVPPKTPPIPSRIREWAELRTRQDMIDRQARELSEVSTAIGTDAYLDPPDGGSVSLGEQVRRMRDEMVGLLQRVYQERHDVRFTDLTVLDDIERVLQRHQQ